MMGALLKPLDTVLEWDDSAPMIADRRQSLGQLYVIVAVPVAPASEVNRV